MWLYDVRISEKLSFEMRKEVINIAPSAGFLADLDAIQTEPRRIVFDHAHSGMTAPALGFTLNGVKDLKGFDALLHQALGVEDPRGLFDVGIWEEDLHSGFCGSGPMLNS